MRVHLNLMTLPKHSRSVSYWNLNFPGSPDNYSGNPAPNSNLNQGLPSLNHAGSNPSGKFHHPGGSLGFPPHNQPHHNISNLSNIHTAPHSRTESKNMKPEESNVEINEHLKYIEELLKDGEDDNKSMWTLSDKDPSFISPNLSYTVIPHAPFVMPKNHAKALSGDFLPNQVNQMKPGFKFHGRGQSVFSPAENRFKPHYGN